MNSGNYKQKKKKRLSTLPKKNYGNWTSCPPKNPIQENVSLESSSSDWTANFAYPENFSSSGEPSWPTNWPCDVRSFESLPDEWRKKNDWPWESPPDEWRKKNDRPWESPPDEWRKKNDWPWESPPDEWRKKNDRPWESPSDEWREKDDRPWESPPDEWREIDDRPWGFLPLERMQKSECSWESPGDWKASPSPDEVKPNACDWSVKDWSHISNKVYNAQSEIKQETNSENVEDLKTKVGDCNLNGETDTVYDTLSNLSSDFLSALQNNSFTDVSIKCGDYVQMVHKFVLAARSPVFEAMFSTPMEESEKGVVTISDIDASVLDDLLAFIYGAQVKNMTESKACDLLYVAEKYQVKGLKNICTNYLRSCLSVPNAIQILQFADLYDEELKKDIMSYVCENFSALKVTEEWKTLQKTKPNLSIDVYSMVVEKYEEHVVSRSAKNS